MGGLIMVCCHKEGSKKVIHVASVLRACAVGKVFYVCLQQHGLEVWRGKVCGLFDMVCTLIDVLCQINAKSEPVVIEGLFGSHESNLRLNRR